MDVNARARQRVDAHQGGTGAGASPGWLLPVCGLVWLTTGANYVGFALAVETMPPFLMSGARLLPAGIMVLAGVLVMSRGRIPWPTPRQWRNIAIMATLLVVLGQGAVVWSVQVLDAGVAAIITASMPAWVALIGIVALSERPGWLALVGVVVGFVGLAILSIGDGFGGDASLAPILVTISGTVAGAVAVVFGRHADLPDDVVPAAALQIIVAGIVFLVIAGFAGEFAEFRLADVSRRSWMGWLSLLLLGGLVGHHALVWTTRHAPPTLASTFAYMGPIVGLFLSALILEEALTATKLAAAGLTMLGAILMMRGARS